MNERSYQISRRDLLKGVAGMAGLGAVGVLVGYDHLPHAEKPHVSSSYAYPDSAEIKPTQILISESVTMKNREVRFEEGSYVFAGAEVQLLPIAECTGVRGCGRGEPIVPTKIVEHITESRPDQSMQDVIEVFATGASGTGVGSHFIIDQDGSIVQLVEAQRKTIDLTYSVLNYVEQISIENMATPAFYEDQKMPEAQYRANLLLVSQLMEHYNIPIGNKEAGWRSNTNEENPQSGDGIFGHYQLNTVGTYTKRDPGMSWMQAFRADLHRVLAQKQANPAQSFVSIVDSLNLG